MVEADARWWVITGTCHRNGRVCAHRVRGSRAHAERLVRDLNAGEDPVEPRTRWELSEAES